MGGISFLNGLASLGARLLVDGGDDNKEYTTRLNLSYDNPEWFMMPYGQFMHISAAGTGIEKIDTSGVVTDPKDVEGEGDINSGDTVDKLLVNPRMANWMKTEVGGKVSAGKNLTLSAGLVWNQFFGVKDLDSEPMLFKLGLKRNF